MKNKHYDMIVAKAANMELVVFFNPSFGSGAGKWEEATTTLFPAFHPDTEYFLCLPQHKEACLHWLNGGEVEENYNSQWDKVERHSWHDQSVFNFYDGYIIRIKPKKEKRLIAIDPKTSEVFVVTSACIADHGFQLIEIEVEV
ncbi:hypothetical protein VPHK373_0004 [Vibrio phage K373]